MARFYDYHALCEDCGWESWAKNAQGNAARHHDATGHTVGVDVSGHVRYGNVDAKEAEAAPR